MNMSLIGLIFYISNKKDPNDYKLQRPVKATEVSTTQKVWKQAQIRAVADRLGR